MTARVAILGFAYSVPTNIRTNDDPVFDWLHANSPPMSDLFAGYEERRILGTTQRAEDLMVSALEKAMFRADLDASEVDALFGASSASHYLAPDELFSVHSALGMRNDAWVLPVLGEFSNFQSALLLADSMIRSGRIQNAAVVCGCDWSRHVDYHDAVSISIGDGAGAVILGLSDDPQHFECIDGMTETRSDMFGCMVLAQRLVTNATATMPPAEADANDEVHPMPVGTAVEGAPLYTGPIFHMYPDAQEVFTLWGETAPPALARQLLDKYGVNPEDVCLIGHQASTVLINAWATALQPGQYLNTIASFGNITLASVPVTFACLFAQITKDWVLLLGMGLGIHASAVLLRRGAVQPAAAKTHLNTDAALLASRGVRLR